MVREMDAIRVLLAADARRRWRSWLALVVLVAVVGGVTMASIAGWRRTTTAMDRFMEYHRPFNAYAEGDLDRGEVLAIEGVEGAMGGDYFLLVPVDGKGGVPHPEMLGKVSPFSYDHPGMFRSAVRPIVVAGRLADPAAEREVMVDEELAELYDLAPGRPLVMQAYGLDQAEDLFDNLGSLAPTGKTFTFTVTGIIRSPQDVQRHQDVPDVVYLGSSEVQLGPAFDAAHRGIDVASLGWLFGDLQGPGADQYELRVDFTRITRAALEEAVTALDADASLVFGAGDAQTAADEASRRIRLQASLLLAFGVVVGAGGLVLVLQALRRQLEDDVAVQQAMQVLGMDRRSRVRMSLAKGSVAALCAATGAVGIALALSPLAPVGDARRAEIDPGLHADLTVLALGFAAVGALVVGRILVPAWRTRPAVNRVGTARVGLSDRAARAGLPPSVVAGVRAAALASGGRTVAITAFVAALGIVGGLGFAGSEGRLASDPALWGWTFDAVVGDGNDPGVGERAHETLADHPMVASYALVSDHDDVILEAAGVGVDVGASALVEAVGHIEPRMLAGSAPRTVHDIALGGSTARQLGVSVGDEVQVDVGEGPVPFTVSGLAVMNLGFDSERIGEGSILTPAGIERAGGELETTFVLVEYAPGVDADVAYRSLREDWGNTVLRPLRATDVNQLHEVRYLPVGFSLLLAVLSVVTLAFVLALTIRRRRRDLALLRTLGFDGRQLRISLAAQATTLVLPAVFLGALGGIVAGRVTWSLTTTNLGAPEVHVAPIAALVAVVVGALVVSSGVAAPPGRAAARARSAVILRTE